MKRWNTNILLSSNYGKSKFKIGTFATFLKFYEPTYYISEKFSKLSRWNGKWIIQLKWTLFQFITYYDTFQMQNVKSLANFLLQNNFASICIFDSTLLLFEFNLKYSEGKIIFKSIGSISQLETRPPICCSRWSTNQIHIDLYITSFSPK